MCHQFLKYFNISTNIPDGFDGIPMLLWAFGGIPETQPLVVTVKIQEAVGADSREVGLLINFFLVFRMETLT